MTTCKHCGGSGVSPDGGMLRRSREAGGMGLREMARRLGLSHVYLSEVERGVRVATGAKVRELQRRYADALSV